MTEKREHKHDYSGGRDKDLAKSDGAFFTRRESAVALARLSIDNIERIDWTSFESVASISVCDPACGDGRLLLAAMERIIELGGADAARAMAQTRLIGMDIDGPCIEAARKMIADALPGLDRNRLSIFQMPHGLMPDGTVRAGSLELLRLDNVFGGEKKRTQVDLFRGEDQTLGAHIIAGPDTWEPWERNGQYWMMMAYSNGWSSIYAGPFSSRDDAEAWPAFGS